MLKTLKSRLIQGYRTNKFPYAAPAMPVRFSGMVKIDSSKLTPEFALVVADCPCGALKIENDKLSLDTGKCIFCGKCTKSGAIEFTGEHDLASFNRDDLIKKDNSKYEYITQPDNLIREMCGRSLKIRQVSAGGCAACELDFNVLGTLAWDMGRLNIQVVASPRHADCILVTGPVTRNMVEALKKAHAAMPDPAFVIACGCCAISGGIYADSEETLGGVDSMLNVDLYIPGCPPHPATLLEALVRFMGKNLQKK